MATPAWVERLKKRWGLTSNVDFIIIFCVFAFTGTFTAISKRWFFAWAGLDTQPLWIYILCYIAYMLIAYQIILLTVGTIAGFPRFFWAFVKRFTGWLLKPFGVKLPK